MQWKKIGRIFEPQKHQLPNGCVHFAQSPQTLIFSNFVRVYFSCRAVDARGKFLSHIAYVDMQKDLRNVIRVSSQVVLPLGNLGTFDEHGIFPINVLRHNGLIYGYTCGWSRRQSVSVETAIGLAISHDGGETFERIGEGPILASSLHEPCLVGDAFVRIIDGVFHMWYIYGIGWRAYVDGAPPDRTYKIGHATSTDGIDWRKDDTGHIVEDRLGPDESQALPTVVRVNGRYLMAFCYRQSFDFRSNPDRGYRLGFAWSDDLRTWIRDDDSLKIVGTPGDWDGDMQCYPHLFEMDGRIYLLYNGNAFGRDGFGLAILEY